MMISNELAVEIKRRSALWRGDEAPDTWLEEFILESLSETDATEYEIDELLEPDVIALVLELGKQQLEHETTGGIRMISNGRVVDLSHLAAKYRLLFDQWARRGWVKFVNGVVVRAT